MQGDSFTFKADDGKDLFTYRWRPEIATKAIIHVAHGMSEHAGRYERAAESLTAAGYVVYANDQRGHGKTARADFELGFVAPSGGFRRVLRDLEQLVEHEKRENPGLPLVLFGHSMGSYLAQAFMSEHGRAIQAVVLSGSSGKPTVIGAAGKLVARAERLRVGERGRSAILQKLSFERFNAVFRPNRTPFDWLSRDSAEVDRYIADPRCGFACSTSLWVDVLDALPNLTRPDRLVHIPKDLPVYIFSGSRDPVGEDAKSLERLLAAYRRAGLRSVTHRFYAGGRHEMLNETNRDEVMRDLLAWLDAEV